jgi:predicted anti-sigma-YlaC factor YlaD
MCYELEELQQIIDNTYEGDLDEVLAHIKACPKCREKFQKLKQQDKLNRECSSNGYLIPPRLH